ncbi:unnamed protein product [Pleuronectes platessa]|uniref:Uncharacterized protein n=1 Tax=Pleuronectes platessa TaxID=8262 RepID=A0A9N7UCC8_PLEPL|nr:unnamed protein product [Pleuronectes platessa]
MGNLAPVDHTAPTRGIECDGHRRTQETLVLHPRVELGTSSPLLHILLVSLEPVELGRLHTTIFITIIFIIFIIIINYSIIITCITFNTTTFISIITLIFITTFNTTTFIALVLTFITLIIITLIIIIIIQNPPLPPTRPSVRSRVSAALLPQTDHAEPLCDVSCG